MKNKSLSKLLSEINQEMLNKLIALGKLTIKIEWNGQEFTLEFVENKDEEK